VAGQSIYLIGFSGAGKSTIARLVGARLGWQAYDLDRIIVERSGMDIPTIFEREGEDGFRARETAALHSVAGLSPCVVATGGGAPLRKENRRLMAGAGWVFTLEGRTANLLARIQRQREQEAPDAVRPLLAAGDPLAQARALKASRQPIYALADWTVHTDRLSPEQVADEIVRALAILGPGPAPAERLDEA
jgi:shikimate kinase